MSTTPRSDGQQFTIRSAVLDDEADILEWRNDPFASRMSVGRNVVARAEHAVWYRARLADPDCRMYVAVDERGAKLGIVRFDRIDRTVARVSINVAPHHRGRGVGASLLRVGVETYLAQETGIQSIEAIINASNKASERIFALAHFGDQHAAGESGFFAITYRRRPVNRETT